MASLEDDFLHEASNVVQNLVYSDTEAFIDSDDEAEDDDPTSLSSTNSTPTINPFGDCGLEILPVTCTF